MAEPGKVVGLPPKPYFYTIDQIAYFLQLDEEYIKRKLLHYDGRSVGTCPKDKMTTVNVAPADEKPEWRILERTLIRWMRFKGYKYRENGYVGERSRSVI